MYNLTDKVLFDGVRTTKDGYIVGDVKISRTGIQVYQASEVGRTGRPIRVFRPASSVFDEESMASMAHRPVTLDHPAALVDASNWRNVSVGQTGGEVKRDGEFVSVPMVVMDGVAIAAIQGGQRELSVGYNAHLDFTHGFTDAGEEYDAIQTNIRGNHVAIVKSGKAGSEARIGDDAGKWGDEPLKTGDVDMPNGVKTRAVIVDGLSVETTDAGAQALEKLQGDIKKITIDAASAVVDQAKELESKDAEIATKDAKIDALEKAALTDADLDAKVQARASLIADANAISPNIEIKGLNDDEIRKAVVLKAVGDTVKDKPQAYIDARFDILVEDAKKGGFKVGKVETLDRDKMYADRDAKLQNAYLGKEA